MRKFTTQLIRRMCYLAIDRAVIDGLASATSAERSSQAITAIAARGLRGSIQSGDVRLLLEDLLACNEEMDYYD